MDYPQTISRRLGYRTPRSSLLPPYLTLTNYIPEFTDAVDEVFGSMVDNKIRVLQNIRNMWVTNPDLERKVLAQEMLDFSDWSMPERELLVQQVNMLGMKLKSAGVLSDDAYQRIARFLGLYWFQKGTEAFIEFINYCVGSQLKIYKLWSKNNIPGEYSDLTRAASDGTPPGAPIWEGGDWFPTTHVEIESTGDLLNLDVHTLTEFFYEIANYNLVLNGIVTSLDIPIVDEPDSDATKVVAMGIYLDATFVTSNQGRYGAEGPPLNAVQGLPLQRLAGGGGNATILLAEPTGWYLSPDGKRIPIYGPEDRLIRTQGTIPMTLRTSLDPADPALALMYGPKGWAAVPGSGRSQGRIPVWSAAPQAAIVPTLPTNIQGGVRALLANPLGWTEINPGEFAPYW